MQKIFLCALLIVTMGYCEKELSKAEKAKKIRTEKAIQEALEKEKKYAREQDFYDKNSYDFESRKVNEESLKSIPKLEPDDLDMDHVYD